MANQIKRVSELRVTTTLAANDRVVVLANVSGNQFAGSITLDNFATSLVLGPYVNDAAANAAGVAIGCLYYDTSGDVHVRLS
jgi:hypothetical protein